VAGEVVARISGQPWAAFVKTRLLKPLGMARSAAGFSRLPDATNFIDAHAEVDGRVLVIQRDQGLVTGAAGGIYSSVNDLSKWALMLLGGPGAPAPLLKPATQYELWSPQTILRVIQRPKPTPYNTHFGPYGLGWFLRDVRGYKEASHTGGLPGMVTQVVLVPEQRLGIIVLTNQESGLAFTAVNNFIEDQYLGLPAHDPVAELAERAKGYIGGYDRDLATAIKQVALAQKAAPKRSNYAPYVGRYHDAWFGDVTLAAQGPQLWLRAARSPRLVGQLLPYRGNTYVVRWRDRSFHADAFATFALDEQGKATSLKMKPVSEETDFSYDFQDLDLQRVL